jgi:hypothetical protein
MSGKLAVYFKDFGKIASKPMGLNSPITLLWRGCLRFVLRLCVLDAMCLGLVGLVCVKSVRVMFRQRFFRVIRFRKPIDGI